MTAGMPRSGVRGVVSKRRKRTFKELGRRFLLNHTCVHWPAHVKRILPEMFPREDQLEAELDRNGFHGHIPEELLVDRTPVDKALHSDEKSEEEAYEQTMERLAEEDPIMFFGRATDLQA